VIVGGIVSTLITCRTDGATMTDILLETVRIALIAVICFSFIFSKINQEVKKQSGWRYLAIGFTLILLGTIFDLTDNFPELNKYIIIGDTPYQAFMEKVVCYLVGFLLLAVGFNKWLPAIAEIEVNRKQAEDANQKLNEAIKKIKTLEGIIPICAYCKNIRDDKGAWEKIEVYVSQNSNADFSHGICPDCSQEHFPQLIKKRK